MPLEYISLSCCGQDIEAQYLIDRLKENNVYSADFCENPQDVCCGKRPIDIKCGNWFGAVVAEMVLAGLKENRDYNILHTYGMKWEDGFYAFFKENDEDEE